MMQQQAYPRSKSSEGRAPVDAVLCTLLYLRALAALAAFSAACTAAALLAGTWLLHRPHLWAGAAATLLAAELTFAWAWVAKYRRLNAQPAPHAPKTANFNPRDAFDRCALALLSWHAGASTAGVAVAG